MKVKGPKIFVKLSAEPFRVYLNIFIMLSADTGSEDRDVMPDELKLRAPFPSGGVCRHGRSYARVARHPLLLHQMGNPR